MAPTSSSGAIARQHRPSARPGTAIIFDRDGRTRDGQHNWHAVIRSGVAIQMVTGITNEPIRAVPQGNPTRARDGLVISEKAGVTPQEATDS